MFYINQIWFPQICIRCLLDVKPTLVLLVELHLIPNITLNLQRILVILAKVSINLNKKFINSLSEEKYSSVCGVFYNQKEPTFICI